MKSEKALSGNELGNLYGWVDMPHHPLHPYLDKLSKHFSAAVAGANALGMTWLDAIVKRTAAKIMDAAGKADDARTCAPSALENFTRLGDFAEQIETPGLLTEFQPPTRTAT